MSEDQENKKVDLPLEEAAPEEEARQIDANNFKTGFFAGVDNDGQFAFVPMGKEISLTAMVGVHEMVGAELHKAVIHNQAMEIDQIKKMLQHLNGNLVRLSGQVDMLAGGMPEPTPAE